MRSRALSGNPYLLETLERIVAPLFAFFVMKHVRRRESYVESAEVHAKIVDAMPTSSAAELREMMKEASGGWQDDALKLLFPQETQTQPRA